MGLSSLLPLFQIIRKVVRQIDSSGADDTQEHEEVIAEGPLEDPSEVDTDTDSFMKLAQVLRWLQPLGGSVCQGAGPSAGCSPVRLPWASTLCSLPLASPL